MTINEFINFLNQNPGLAFVGVLLLSIVVLFLARVVIGRGMYYLAKRTETEADDIIVESLHPFRFAWIAPLLVIYSFAYLLPDIEFYIQQTALFFILWIAVMTLNSLLDAFNRIYESRPTYSGVSIQSYLDLVKMLILMVAGILSVSIITSKSPSALLTGLGAIAAILLLVFKDTLLSLVASIQISSNNLIEEGDWIEVPSYGADGDVIDISLHSVKIQNWNKTISVIPTHKFMEVSFKNWRGMSDSGGRRIKRSISLDLATVKFCDDAMLDGFRKFDLLHSFIDAKQVEISEFNKKNKVNDSVLANGRRMTNVGVFREYMAAYLHNRTDIHQDGMTFLIRQLEPGPTGLPLQIYVFTTTTEWVKFEGIQSDIFDHFLAVLPQFDLRVFQEPTGFDFARR